MSNREPRMTSSEQSRLHTGARQLSALALSATFLVGSPFASGEITRFILTKQAMAGHDERDRAVEATVRENTGLELNVRCDLDADDPRAGTVTMMLVGDPVPVVHINKDVCDRLNTGNPPIASDLYVAAHESEHLRGIDDEAEATCRVLIDLPIMLEDAGWSDKAIENNRYQVLSWINSATPVSYRSPDCYVGGPLDNGLNTTYLPASVDVSNANAFLTH